MTWLPASYTIIELVIVRTFLYLAGICTLPFLGLLVLDLSIYFGKIIIKNTSHIKRRLSELDLYSLSRDSITNELVYSRSMVNLKILDATGKSNAAAGVGGLTGKATFKIGNEDLEASLLVSKVSRRKSRKAATDAYQLHHSKSTTPTPSSKLIIST